MIGCRAETGLLPPPPTQQELERLRLRKLQDVVDWGREAHDAEIEVWRKFAARLAIQGYDIQARDIYQAKKILKFAERLHYGGRSGSIG